MFCNRAICQVENDIQLKMTNTIPAETVKIHINDNVLVSGETLYYKIFCLDNITNKVSAVSKMAYVELLGIDNNTLFKHKIKLRNSIANSQFFIPANVKTGHYKLIAYTQWTKNNDENAFFQKDIYIINPFLGSSNKLQDSIENTDSNTTEIRQIEISNINTAKTQSIALVLDSNVYKTRSKVALDVKNLKGTTVYGNYSLSVRELDSVGLQREPYGEVKETLETYDQFYPPELRGEIISGYIVSKENTKKGLPDIIVSLSITGENPVYKNVITDKKGRFFFNIHENYTSSNCILQIVDENKENFTLIIDDKSINYSDSLKFENLYLNPNTEDWIVSRSIKNQIENSYNEIKQDSTIYQDLVKPFYSTPTVSYVLDDYKRFGTVRETFIEVIEGAGIRKNKDKYVFNVYYREEHKNDVFSIYTPLILIDGLLIQDNQYLIDYNPYKIESISLVKGVYFFGPSIFDGIIDIRTKKGDFSLPATLAGLKSLNLEVPQERKIYYRPNYQVKTEDLKRIPDYRHQLLWQPSISLNSELKTIDFFTSDTEGVFEIVLEGYTVNGNYITTKTYFEVKK